ncbi:hypothetical protein PAAG_12100 [Paracoccidioides lutzii Pb01]|uniref:Uncharacterized protein n=1 Tax=Paracoccidioides lutzii (strain ATCC MYA-826 / Pb01) TaxID=502779 RepID=A0A0A2V0D2_PARBA|nr:hypothetical protein PAAG_12100 [Paracoccidioides lutzii Pb01]KGQ01241.1 hypothetical protein PAAG_12100 [Paracoccidioides lutzii Pb01]
MSTVDSKSDIFISFQPSYLAKVVFRVKNYEFPKYHLPPQVNRLWIYETRPISTINVSLLSVQARGLRPRQAGASRKAYQQNPKVRGATQINSFSNLKENGWLNGPLRSIAMLKMP